MFPRARLGLDAQHDGIFSVAMTLLVFVPFSAIVVGRYASLAPASAH